MSNIAKAWEVKSDSPKFWRVGNPRKSLYLPRQHTVTTNTNKTVYTVSPEGIRERHIPSDFQRSFFSDKFDALSEWERRLTLYLQELKDEQQEVLAALEATKVGLLMGAPR